MTAPNPPGSSSANTDPNTGDKHVFSVSQLNRRARQLLETHLSRLWVEGEVSNLARPSSGHWYFTLKDEGAQIRCAMFRNRNRGVKFRPEDGQQILVRGRISLYENRGDYQLIAEHIEPAGLGALQRRFELLKAKLEDEGLFDEANKQALPAFPKHLALITSPTGAAVRDVLHVLERRYPGLPVSIYPSPVQGAQAAPAIIEALALANAKKECDLIILTRGGGSLEDLWPFNEEAVARAIAASAIPVISAVGHETDVTIADFVADVRAPTPSAAAELASPDSQQIQQVLTTFCDRLTQLVGAKLENIENSLDNLRRRLRHPSELLQKQGQHLDHLEIRLLKSMQLQVHEARSQLQQLLSRYQGQSPQLKLTQISERSNYLLERLNIAMKHGLMNSRNELSSTIGLLQAVSPLNTLQRGYAITQNQAGKVITHIADTQPDDRVTVTLVDGILDCEVQTISANTGATDD